MFVCISELWKDPALLATCAETQKDWSERCLSALGSLQAAHGALRLTFDFVLPGKAQAPGKKEVPEHIMRLLCCTKSKYLIWSTQRSSHACFQNFPKLFMP